MDTVGLRELRQAVSDLVRRVERGEEILITVSCRPSAKLVPALQARWHRWNDLIDLFTGTVDPDWNDDRELLDNSIRDPWLDQ